MSSTQGAGVERKVCMIVRAGLIWACCATLAASQAIAQDRPQAQEEQPQDASGETMGEISGPVEYQTMGERTIILQGSEEDLVILEAMLRKLDLETPKPQIQFVQLLNAPAVELAGKLEQLFTPLLGPDDKLKIVADEGSNSLLVAAPERLIDEIIRKATELDKVRRIIFEYEVIQLKYIPAAEAATVLQAAITKLQKKKVGGGKAAEEISIEANDRNNSLFITAPREAIDQIKKLVGELDVEPIGFAQAKLLFIPLLNAQAKDLAESLDKMLKAQGEQAAKLKETIKRLRLSIVGPDGKVQEFPELDLEKPIKIVPEIGTNALIIATHDQNVPPMTALVKLLDSVPLGAEMGIDFFPLRFADAESVATILKDMFEAGKELPAVPGKDIKGAVPEGIPGKAFVYNVGIHADTRTNMVVVSGRPEQIAIAHTVINQVDIEGGFLFPKAKIFYLEHTDAQRLADVLTQLNEQTVQSLEARKVGQAAIDKERALIIPDSRSNGLIISATDEKFAQLTDLARKLDGAPAAFMNEIRIINCTNTNAADLATKIEELWQRKIELRAKEDLPQDKPVIVADLRSNALVVASNIEDYDAIKKLVEDLEKQPLAPLAMIKLIPVKNNDAGELASMLKSLFDERLQLRQTDGAENNADKVAVTSDAATNTLLVGASPENYAEIARIVESLDVIPELEGVVRTFILKNADAANVAAKIKELFEQGVYKPGAPGAGSPVAEAAEKVALIADARVNALMISASRPNMAIIEQLIKEFDGVDASALMGTTEIFKLQHADALKVSEILTQVFEGLKSTSDQEVFVVPTIIPVEGSNALIVAGSREGILRARELLAQIDQPSVTPTAQFAVYTLKHASGVKLAPKMQEMFDKRAEGAEGKRTPVNIQAVEGSNSIIASASADDHGALKALIELLDVKSNLNQQLRIFNLENAKAENTATLLQELFKPQEGAAGQGPANAIAVQPVPWTGSIAVWAAPGQMEDIEEMIARIDTNKPKREMMLDAIQLKQARAEDLAEAMSNVLKGETDGGGGAEDAQAALILSFFSEMPDGSQVLQKLLKQDITIVPYVQTNSLLVMAPPDSVDMLRSLIKRLDDIPPITAEVEVFALKNASSEQIIETLQKVFEAESGGGGGEGPEVTIGGVAGTLMGQKLSFSADQRTNSVIVAGNEQYLRIVGKLINDLDGEAREDRITTVYRINNTTAEALATAMKDFNQQETERVSAIEDVAAEQLKAERAITVVPDEPSNAVMLSMDSRFESQYMDLVRELDRAPDQVLIEVMLVEVTLDDRFELGIEFAAQDLLFTEKAFLGPNGTIKGPEFDFVGGTDLGAVGSGGGFAFTMTGEDFNFLFHAFQSDGRAELISRPSIMVKNNETGIIEIITEVPIPSATNISTGGTQQTSVTYEDAGITLEVEPHINPDGFVQLKVKPEVSSIGAPVQVSGDVQAATFNRTRLDTTITVKDGETIIIGGLIESSKTENEAKVPLMGDLPIVGQLFRSNDDSQRRKELLIVITATVLRTAEDAYRTSIAQRDKTDIIPESVKQSPLMDKLQLKPEGEELEMVQPQTEPHAGPPAEPPVEEPIKIQDKDMLKKPRSEDHYGPSPSHYYGPPVPRRARQVSFQ